MNAIPPKALPALTKSGIDFVTDTRHVRLAREIAMEIHDLPEILKRMEISEFEWNMIRTNARFQSLLTSAMEEWNSATNTAERVRIKSLAFVEEALPEFFALAHKANESLSGKVEVLKQVSKLAGIGEKSAAESVGSRFSVTINMGSTTVSFEKQLPTQVTIDQESAQEPELLPDVALNSELG